MRNIIVFITMWLISLTAYGENDTIVVKGKFVRHEYDYTNNANFINIAYVFSTRDDTIRINKKQHYLNPEKKTLMDLGLGVGQNFFADTTYTIVLEPICISKFIKTQYPITYYHTNCLPDDTGERYVEIQNNVPLNKYSCENRIQSWYVDIDNKIYRVISIEPLTDLLKFLVYEKVTP